MMAFISVYIFLGTPMSLVELMEKMETGGLFDKGEYIVIYLDMNTYSDQEAHKYIWSRYWWLMFNYLKYLNVEPTNNNQSNRLRKIPHLNFQNFVLFFHCSVLSFRTHVEEQWWIISIYYQMLKRILPHILE